MFWKWFWKVLAMLLVIAIFMGGGFAIYQAGFAQGVSTSLRMVEEGAPATPYEGLYHRPFGIYRPFFPGLGLFLGLMLVLFLFGAIGRLFRYSFWRSKGMPYPHGWGPGWHRYHHPDCRKPGNDADKPSSQGDAEEDAAPAA